MKNNEPICIIGGYDLISGSFFRYCKQSRADSIFINVNNHIIKKRNIYNYRIFQLEKIFNLLKKKKIKYLIFLGKVDRPNLSEFQLDKKIAMHIDTLMKVFLEGDGKILSTVIDIFTKNGYSVLSPKKLADPFFFKKKELDKITLHSDKLDSKKSIRLLNTLSKFDNAQSIVCVNGYIIAIEAAEGTDNTLKRVIKIRKKLNQLHVKSGLLVKIPKKGQSKLIDLPVIGVETLKLVYKANLNGLVIDYKNTIIYKKEDFIKFANESNIKIFNIS